MTTILALASKHALVMGTDSLGTETRQLVDPMTLIEKYFDPAKKFVLRRGNDGEPVLDSIFTLMDEAEQVPYNQLLHVNKLFKLGVLPVAVAFTGITSIANNPVRSLVTQFADSDKTIAAGGTLNYTVGALADRLLKFLRGYYESEFPPEGFRKPSLELLVGGYNRNVPHFPTVVRLNVAENKAEVEFAPGTFGIAFAGTFDWIQRIIHGTDFRNRLKLITRTYDLLNQYRERMAADLRQNSCDVELPEAASFGKDFFLFNDWELDQLDANWAEFSEQNAIDCVDFLLDIMIRAQGVSQQLPTVGGDVHIAVIRKGGFYPVTKEVWRHGQYEVPIPEVGT